ncbi:hypothetical protein PG993_009090 [Apiospora rasikravindrae]|uniref:Transmembrane protein n=1 Tax=Apiospora rasikravindrae TaxID=990691 RepID=A0ABR1SIF6_9PEZI
MPAIWSPSPSDGQPYTPPTDGSDPSEDIHLGASLAIAFGAVFLALLCGAILLGCLMWIASWEPRRVTENGHMVPPAAAPRNRRAITAPAAPTGTTTTTTYGTATTTPTTGP